MKMITLDAVIESQIKNDPEFAEQYQKELLINEISQLVVGLRNAAHLTQSELAKRAGTTQPVIARIESGTDARVPSLLLLARIASASHANLHISFHGIKKSKVRR
jgi:predicted transcriptional regulator